MTFITNTQSRELPAINRRQSALMLLYLVLGVLSAVIHHLYYLSLHHRYVYTGTTQQWPIRVGASLTFLTVALCKMAVGAAYTQYVWTRLRTRTFSLLGIDELLALLTDATGLFSKEILKEAKSVALIALIAWLLPIATTIPAATLAVSPIVVPFLAHTSVPTLQTNINQWSSDMLSSNILDYAGPTAYVRQVTVQTAVEGTIGDIPLLAPNATYTVTFPGPALKCGYASSVQQRLIDNYGRNTSQGWATAADRTSIEDWWVLLVYNAFNPDQAPDYSLSPTMSNGEALASTGESGLQFWIQTPERNITCLQGFSYFSVLFNWENGSPDHRVTRLNFTTNTSDPTGWRHRASSVIFTSLFDILFGNLTVDKSTHSQLKGTSNIMLTGLRGCDEIADNYWLRQGEVPRIPEFTTSSHSSGLSAAFPTNPYLCRNKSLAAAIEDLSNNITISFLGLDLTSQNTTPADVLFTPTRLLYVYDPKNLIVTYVTVGIISLIAVMFGFAALDENGITHSLRFSAIMNMTRNPELAMITNDSGFGRMPLEKEVGKTRLRFGVLKGMAEGDSHKFGFVLADDDKEVADK